MPEGAGDGVGENEQRRRRHRPSRRGRASSAADVMGAARRNHTGPMLPPGTGDGADLALVTGSALPPAHPARDSPVVRRSQLDLT